MAHASVPHVMGMYGCAACNAAVLRCRLAPCSVRVVRSVMIRAPRLRQQRAGEPNYPSRGSGHRRAGHNSSVLLGLVCLGLRCADMLGELLCDMRHSTLALQERMEQENKNAYEAFHGLMRGPVDEGAHSTAAVRADAWLDVSEATVPLPALLQLVGPSSAVTSTSTSLHDIVHGGGEFEACDCCDPPTWLRRRQGGSARALHAMAVARRRAAEEALDAAHQAELVAEHTDEEGMFEGLETTDSMQRALDKCDQCHLDVCTDMRVNHYLPQSSVQCHKEGIARLASAQSAAIKEALRGKLKEGVDLDELIDPIMKAHEKFRDKRAEARARDSSYHYQVTPRKRLLPPTAGGNPVTVWDVPLEESLQRELYYNPSFSEYFVDWGDCPASPPGVYRSARNGSAAHNHPTLGNTDWDGPPRLAFGAYTDDVEVCNPIGSARCKHKVALHYAVLLNAPPHISSKLDLIFLVSVTLRKSQDAAGVAEVVSGDGSCEPAMPGGGSSSFGASLRRLHAGITFAVPNAVGGGYSSVLYQGWLLLVCADTLAAAELIGFKKGFSKDVKGICWQCDAPGGKALRCTNSFVGGHSHFQERTTETYRKQRLHSRSLPIRKQRGRTKEMRKACSHSSATCVCSQAEYNQAVGVCTFQHSYRKVPYFLAVEYVPRDPMHVEMEGNLKVHLYAFLYTCIARGWLTRTKLNAAIRAYQWPGGSYIPEIPHATLTGTAGRLPKKGGSIPFNSGPMMSFVTQSLTLLRPILSKAGLASKEWQAWVAHTEYFVAMMKSEFTDASIALLDEMIQKAQTLFIQLYPHLWKPKNHFAQHIPADIKRFGPPRTYWCMRFEAKNQEHKRAAKTGNWRDTPGTIAHFWVDRSAFRLRTEAHRPVEPTTPVGEPVGTTSLADGTSRINLGALLHHGVNLGVGDWLLVTPPDGAGPPVLANVFSLYAIEDSNGEVTGYWMDANTWWPAAVLRRDNHGMIVADGSTFTSGYEVASFSLSSAALTPLYVVELEQDDGVLAFLERT